MKPSNFPKDSREKYVFTDAEERAIQGLLIIANEWQNQDDDLGLQDQDDDLGLQNQDDDLGLQDQDVEMEDRNNNDSDDKQPPIDDWEKRWAEERARRQAVHDYEVAKNFALNLHSDRNLKIDETKNKEKEEEKVKVDEDKSDFQIAKEAIKKRREEISTTSDMEVDLKRMQRKAPMLMDMCLRVLAQNSEAIKSLKLVPDDLRKKLSNHVSGLGRVDSRFMQLLIEDSPVEIIARNCVELLEDDLINIFCDCDRVSLKVLILDLCGRSITDYTINGFLKRSPNGFPSLTTLSLQGAFCLTDNALALISNSSPLLRFIKLTDCSLLTVKALKILADKFGSTLRGLSIGGCQGIKRSRVFSSSLYKFKNLKYLSVSGLDCVNNGVTKKFFTFRSSNLTDLSLANCSEVTDECIWNIGRNCKKLEALDISYLDNLTDKSLEFIAEGCKSLNSVTLTGNRFSDESVAAFLEVSGGSLNQLCLNKVRRVGSDTAFSLAKVCKKLHSLDLSWCRGLTEVDLRRILTCCSSLRSLKLFGWTQVEDTFLEELSRSQVHITGLKMTSLYAHLDDTYPNVGAKFFG